MMATVEFPFPRRERVRSEVCALPRSGYGSMTTVQLYVPGARFGTVSDPFVLEAVPQVMTADVTPGPAWEVKVTAIVDSGVSLKLTVAGAVVQSWLGWVMVTFCDPASME